MPLPVSVLHLLEDHESIGGAEELVATLVTALRESGQVIPEVALVAPNRLSALLKERNIVVHSLGEDRAVRQPLAEKLAELVESRRYQIVQSHLLKMNSLNALAAPMHQAIAIGTCHGLLPQELTFKSRLYGMLAGRKLARTVCVSHTLAKQYQRAYFVPARRVHAIPNAYNPSRLRVVSTEESNQFRSTHQLKADEQIIVAIGNIAPVKGYADLIDALAILQEDHAELGAKLIIAGALREPETTRLKKMIVDYGLGDRVVFLGEFRDISLLFSVASISVSASHQEGFSLTTVEAMASQVPVVVTKSGGPSEIVEEGNCGLVVPIKDAVRLSNSIQTTLTEKNETAKRVQRAVSRVQQEYTPAIMTSRYLELYQNLVSRR
jgi:glycosyltransferase involved in cell wall biosynthesis